MRRGHTLIELMVAVAVFSIISAALYGILSLGNMVYSRGTGALLVRQSVRNATERLIREVRESNTSLAKSVSEDSDRLSFGTPGKTNVRYYLEGTNLMREFPEGNKQLLAANIVKLKFIKFGALLSIDIMGRAPFQGRDFEFALRENVRLRNE